MLFYSYKVGNSIEKYLHLNYKIVRNSNLFIFRFVTTIYQIVKVL